MIPEKCFKVTENVKKNHILKEIGPSYNQNFVPSDNPGQNISHKVKKSTKIGRQFKNLLSNFACFSKAYVKV